LARGVLGDRFFAWVVEFYRAVFVDLDQVAACVPVLAPGAELLDVGGGDGALLERILRCQPHLRATIIDRSAEVGLSLTAASRARVRLLPSTSLRDCAGLGVPAPDLVVIADVLHHVPSAARTGLLREIRDFAAGRALRLVVKDVAPEGWRARLGLLSDRYVTGDRGVELLTPEEARRLVAEVFPELIARDTPLFERDHPNYCIVFEPA
jgi:hypothetical protein